MSKTIKVALAGAGAFGIKHLDGIKNIDGVEVVSLISRDLEKTKEVASKYGIHHVSTDLADSLALPEVDAVILCTPTQMHAAQSLACLNDFFRCGLLSCYFFSGRLFSGYFLSCGFFSRDSFLCGGLFSGRFFCSCHFYVLLDRVEIMRESTSHLLVTQSDSWR